MEISRFVFQHVISVVRDSRCTGWWPIRYTTYRPNVSLAPEQIGLYSPRQVLDDAPEVKISGDGIGAKYVVLKVSTLAV